MNKLWSKKSLLDILSPYRINERSPDETLPMDYLKREYRERISKGPLDYKLQLQLHEPKEGDVPWILHVGREWDEETHPWLDLADIKVTSLLSPTATERLKFIYLNLPASIGLLPAVSVDDPNVVVHIRNEVYVWSQKLRKNRSNKLVPEHLASYLIRVETGSQSGAGTDASISISLTGEVTFNIHDFFFFFCFTHQQFIFFYFSFPLQVLKERQIV